MKYHHLAALFICFMFFFISIGVGLNSNLNYEQALHCGSFCFIFVSTFFAAVFVLGAAAKVVVK